EAEAGGPAAAGEEEAEGKGPERRERCGDHAEPVAEALVGTLRVQVEEEHLLEVLLEQARPGDEALQLPRIPIVRPDHPAQLAVGELRRQLLREEAAQLGGSVRVRL